MSVPIFPEGIQGLSDGKWSGVKGSCSSIVGIDYRTIPGTFQAHQKLTKHSSTTIDELCKNVVNASDGSRVWFSSESGKIWRELSGTYTLVHTTTPASGEAKCLGAEEYNGDVYWATEEKLHRIAVEDLADWTDAEEDFGDFSISDNEFHPMVVQNRTLYIGDKTNIAKVEKEIVAPQPVRTLTTTFGSSVVYQTVGANITPAGKAYPRKVNQWRTASASASSLTQSITVPDTDDRVLIAFLSSVRTDSTTPTLPSSIDFDGQTMNAISSTGGTLGGTNRASTALYRLQDPTVKTGDVTVTLAGAETNLVLQVILFDRADSVANAQTDTESSASGSASLTIGGTAKYQLPIMFTNSASATHTFGNEQIEILDETNGFGRDSSSTYYAIREPEFTDITEFKLVEPERIQTMIDFDIDILVGTRVTNNARVLRWDGTSEGWSAQDDIEEQGINQFIRDDNFVYVQAGSYGRMYFYNGEKLDPFKRLFGEWSPTKTAKATASAFHLGVPLIGWSNIAGNPVKQGVYGFGSYGVGYTKTLSLDYPIPTDVFEGVTIGAMVTDGADLYVSYKDATDVGVAKLDWSNKYEEAYLETTTLVAPQDRSNFSIINGYNADYTDLPANTNVTIGIKKAYEANFDTLSTENMTKLKQVKARRTTTDIANLIIKIGLTVSGNTTPNVENISVDV